MKAGVFTATRTLPENTVLLLEKNSLTNIIMPVRWMNPSGFSERVTACMTIHFHMF